MAEENRKSKAVWVNVQQTHRYLTEKEVSEMTHFALSTSEITDFIAQVSHITNGADQYATS